MIKNIVFDFGGVVLSEDDVWLHCSEIKKLLKVSDEKLSEGWEAAWPESRNGKTSEEDFFKTFLESSVGFSSKEFIIKLKLLYRKKTSQGRAYRTLPRLYRRYKLFGLPNITRDWLDFKINKFNLNKYFDLIISSSGEGVGKPDKEIYLALIKKAKIKPEETLFIDNLERNLIPAREMNFKTILFENYNQLVRDMTLFEINV